MVFGAGDTTMLQEERAEIRPVALVGDLEANDSVGLQHGADALVDGTISVGQRPELAEVGADVLVMPGVEDGLDVGEVLVERGSANADIFGDARHRDGTHPAFGHERRCGLDYGAADLLAMGVDRVGPQLGHRDHHTTCQWTTQSGLTETHCIVKVETMSGPAAAPVVEIAGLTKRYGETVAVDNLSFSLSPGTITGFLGPNGAGKTTTLRLLLGLAEATSGTARLFGLPYGEIKRPGRLVGAVLESDDFHPGRSGRDHLRILAVTSNFDPDRVDEMLDVVGLSDTAARAVRTYSLGMRQRLGLAGALLGRPDLLVLDEPANGLDPAGVRWLRRVLQSFAEAGGTVLVSSHVLAEVAQTVERVVIIDRGRLVADAPLAEIAERGQTLEDAYLALTEAAS